MRPAYTTPLLDLYSFKRPESYMMMDLAQALLSVQPQRHCFTILPSIEPLSEESLQVLEQVPGLSEHMMQLSRRGLSFCIQDSIGSNIAQPLPEPVAMALLQLVIRSRRRGTERVRERNPGYQHLYTITLKARDLSPALTSFLFSGALNIYVKCAQPSPRLMAEMAAKRTDVSIKYCLDGRDATTLRASLLRPDNVVLDFSRKFPALEYANNIAPFFDTDSHVFQQIDARNLSPSSECRLPIVRVRHLLIEYGGIFLSPGSTVQQCNVAFSRYNEVGNVCFDGSRCYCIFVKHCSLHGWRSIHNFSQQTRCIKVELIASEWNEMMALPDHPMLQHLSLLEISPAFVEHHIPSNYGDMLESFLAKFSRLKFAYFSSSPITQSIDIRVRQLLAHKMSQRKLRLSDYNILLADPNLQHKLLVLFAAHLAFSLAGGYSIPTAVSQHLLRAILVVEKFADA
eukprot:TRINITY_DN4618_c0_g1_i2.p1 TRINITY_DN4618_c0_g1~~TRINITY_DN4618_c0_g1_i2.p1  ORF type:complete len:456 (+),score=34.15 TRINITY_DN4618_c0_g1_i2:187-1554(+)